MDNARFDALARSLAAGPSRRQVLSGLIAALAGIRAKATLSKEENTASSGNGGLADAHANGGAVEVSSINSGGNAGHALGVGDSAGDVDVHGGTVMNQTAIDIESEGGTAISDASGGDHNVAGVLEPNEEDEDEEDEEDVEEEEDDSYYDDVLETEDEIEPDPEPEPESTPEPDPQPTPPTPPAPTPPPTTPPPTTPTPTPPLTPTPTPSPTPPPTPTPLPTPSPTPTPERCPCNTGHYHCPARAPHKSGCCPAGCGINRQSGAYCCNCGTGQCECVAPIERC